MKNDGLILWILMLCLPAFGFSQIVTNMDSNEVTSQTPVLQLDLLKNSWGEKLTNILQQCDSVQVFYIESLKNDDLKTPNIEGFATLQEANLNLSEEREFLQLIMDTATYYLEQGAKQCLFMPKMAIRCIYITDTVHVLISLKCDLIRFYGADTTVTLNCDDGHIAILDYFSKAFPNVAFRAPEILAAKSTKPIFYKVVKGDNWHKIHQRLQEQTPNGIRLEDLYHWNQISEPNQHQLKTDDEVIIGFE